MDCLHAVFQQIAGFPEKPSIKISLQRQGIRNTLKNKDNIAIKFFITLISL